MNTSVVSFILATILGTAPPDGGDPISDELVRANLAIFYALAQLGGQAMARKELTHPTGPGRQTGPVHLSDSQGKSDGAIRQSRASARYIR